MINALCNFFGELGVHRLGRNFVHALARYDEIALLPLEETAWFQRNPKPVREFLRNARGDIRRNVGLSIGATDLALRIIGQPRVACIALETTRIPESKLAHLTGVDEIWVPSSWGRKVLVQNGIPAHKVQIVPEGVDVSQFTASRPDSTRNSAAPFRFLSVGKWEVRKAIDLLARAYAETFHPREAVELVLHCHNPHYARFSLPAALARLSLPPRPPIVVSNPLDDSRMCDLYNSCDAFVLPTRGEGWGLPIIEAMACGLPVIATDYSAPCDYLNEENAYLINVKDMIDVDDPMAFDPQLDFGQWAEPDLEHLKSLMRRVFENRDEGRARGKIARVQVVASWTWDHAAEKAWRNITRLRANGAG